MKFRDFKRFDGRAADEIIKWVRDELNSVMRELFIGLNKLKFGDNFQSFLWEGTIAAGQQIQISHPFREAPTGYIIYRQVGNGVIDAGTSEWTNEVLYLRNNGAASVTAKVYVFV